MLAKTWSSAIQGIDAYTVEVEVNATGAGQDTIVNIVGLPDTAVRESRERVWSAMAVNGHFPPRGRTTINLAPADIRKEGAAFDLPIAIGIIAATNGFDREAMRETMIVGELALDGTVRPIKGALPIALHARDCGIRNLFVPAENAAEAAVSDGVAVYGVSSLQEAVDFFRTGDGLQPTEVSLDELYRRTLLADAADFADIKGQEVARRALEIAAAGGHNTLLIGPPGTGKSMLASRLPSIMPDLTVPEALEVTKIHSIAGLTGVDQALVTARPFRAPHHTVSDAGLIGGQSTPRPGEISLAHNGVLFLDELPEFKRNVLEVLRQPLETGEVTISRVQACCTFPSSFMLVAAMNPCPCGHYGSVQRQCRCSSGQIQHYRARISGPLLDRIDLHVEVGPISDDQLLNHPRGESSAQVRERVCAARTRQAERFDATATRCNAKMTPKQMREFCALDTASQSLMRLAISDLDLSARAYDRILRLARTIADLQEADDISVEHLTEAIQYRTLDRQLW